MELINSEKFLYFNKCEVSFEVKESRKIDKLSSNFLFTLNSVYFFLDSSDYKNKKLYEDTEMMERNLICKLNHDKIYVTNYDDITRSITFSHRFEDCLIIMDIKDMQLKDFRDFVNICLIFDGYKIMLEDMDIDYSSYQDYLQYIVENIMSNGGSLVVESEFFSIEGLYLSNFACFLSRLEKITIKVNVANVQILQMMKTVFCELYDENYNIVDLKKTDLFQPKFSLLKVLKLVDNKLNDDAFDNLSSILDQTEFLTELEISKNHITFQTLLEISKRFPNRLKNLEKMNFSFNWIDSYMLDEFMKVALEGLPKLNFIDLTGNYIDNEFLRKFDITYLRKVYNKIHFNEIVVDLSKNNFDNHLIQKNFYLWKIEEETDKIDRGIYTVENFLQNLFTLKINLKFKFELVRHFKETKDFEPYKKNIEEGKCVKISCKSINSEEDKIKLQSKSNKTEIQNYIELLKLFYIIDQFFDPNLNNFNNKDINLNVDIESGFVCNFNINQHYKLLDQAIMNIINSQLLTNNVNQMIHFQVTNNINMVLTHEFYKNNRNEIIQQIIGISSENFSPNFSIEDFHSIFKIIQSHPIEIPLTPLQKYISRAKIDTLLTIKQKDIDSLNYLNEINDYFDTSYNEKVLAVLNSLKEKAFIINEGLIAVMNFDGYANESNIKLFYKEVNNYLDIFLKEASSINLKNDLVSIAKYIQFVRNNKIRAELYTMYQNLLKEENLLNTAGKIFAEFDVMYNKYRNIVDFEKLRIPTEIRVKILSLHPKRLDYLELCQATLADLENDLRVISEKLDEEESYGRRNIHDRIHFLLTSSKISFIINLNIIASAPSDNEINRYTLHKQNNFLKLARILFRYFNNLDISKLKEDFYLEYVIIQDIKDYFKEDQNQEENNKEKELNSADKNSLINYFKLKSMSDRERLRKVDKTALEILEYKKKILTFNSNPLKESLINPSNDLPKEWENQFNSIAVQLNEKLYYIFDRNFYEDNSTIISMPQLCKGIKEYVEFYMELKDRYQKDNFKLYDLLNQEIVFQLYRHINRDDFSEFNKIVRYGLGLFTIMTFYLDLNSVLITALRKWTNYLITRGIYIEYCQKIQNNFLNYSNKKIFWVPSIFEIEHRLENTQIMLKVNFGGSYYEDFEIQEKTTISDLYEKILKDSMFFRDIPEKRLYWIYINYYNVNEMMPVFNEEYVLDLISFLESNSMIEFESWEKKYNNFTSNFDGQDYGDDDEMAERRYMFDDDVVRKPEPFVFSKILFKIQRRLFSPLIMSGEFSQFNENELQLLYEQIKYIFIKKELSILLPDGDTVSVCAILIEDLKRNTYADPTTTLDEFISNNLHRVMPEFKKNIINYKHDNFIAQVEAMMTEKNYTAQTDRELKEEFLKCFKNYVIFFSNIYDIRLKSVHSTYKINMYMPQKFFLLVSLDLIIFLDANRFEIIIKFNYEDIIYCTYISDILYLGITTKNEKGISNELRFRLKTDDARPIMEDILSYSQLYLARKTASQYTNCKVQEFLEEVVACDMKDYRLVYQRKLPQMKNIPSISTELLEIQKIVTHTKFMRNSFILKNPSFFKRGSTEAKRIPSSQRFLFKKEFSIAKLRSKYDDPFAYDEDKSEISIIRDKELDEKDYKIDISNKNYIINNTMSQANLTSQNKNVILSAENLDDQSVNENEVMQYESDNPNEEVQASDNVVIKTSKKLDEAMNMLPFKFLMQENPDEIINEEENY